MTPVLFGSQKKLYAIVEFVCRESALRVLQHPDTLHLHGKKLVVKPREVKLLRRDERAKEEEEGRDVVKETSPPLSSSPLPYFMGGVRMPQEAVAELRQATSVSRLDTIIALVHIQPCLLFGCRSCNNWMCCPITVACLCRLWKLRSRSVTCYTLSSVNSFLTVCWCPLVHPSLAMVL